MLSVLIPTANNAAQLALMMRDMVPAAVDGLVRQLIVVDAAPDAETLLLSSDSGADLFREGLAAAAGTAKWELLLVCPPHLRLPEGWRDRLSSAVVGGVREGRVYGARAGGLVGLVGPRSFAILAHRDTVIAAGDFVGLQRRIRGPRIV